jgi:hypothetical protein
MTFLTACQMTFSLLMLLEERKILILGAKNSRANGINQARGQDDVSRRNSCPDFRAQGHA